MFHLYIFKRLQKFGALNESTELIDRIYYTDCAGTCVDDVDDMNDKWSKQTTKGEREAPLLHIFIVIPEPGQNPESLH